jgi:ssDNA-binding Zn-finger/Zn-ribbon topoisomerase 1
MVRKIAVLRPKVRHRKPDAYSPDAPVLVCPWCNYRWLPRKELKARKTAIRCPNKKCQQLLEYDETPLEETVARMGKASP